MDYITVGKDKVEVRISYSLPKEQLQAQLQCRVRGVILGPTAEKRKGEIELANLGEIAARLCFYFIFIYYIYLFI